jgi:hypothetical protein
VTDSQIYNAFLTDRPCGLKGAFNRVSSASFALMIAELRACHPAFEQSLHLHEDYSTFDCRVTEEGLSGYAVTPDGELTNVFSLVRGGGKTAMEDAQSVYDRLHLNCFDYTESFYARAGFRTLRRETHWNSTEDMPMPDVVFMEWRRGAP